MHRLSTAKSRQQILGVSLIEIFLTIGVIGIVATMSSIAVSSVTKSAQHRKLESDVKILNSAIKLYTSNGGSLNSISDPNTLLAKLKTTRSKDDKRLHAGAASGRLIDARVAAVAVPEGSWKLRASYDVNTQQFAIMDSGSGVEFALDESIAEDSAVIETRSHGAVNYAKNSGWVWDHGATTNPAAPPGPTTFSTNPNVSDSTPGTPVEAPVVPSPSVPSPPVPSPPAPPMLAKPQFDKADGAHPEGTFPLPVAITNIPSASVADAIYRLGSGPWTPYTAPVPVPMNSYLRAQFLSKNTSDYRDSPEASAYYYPVPESLTGTVGGDFKSPVGGPNLVFAITNSADDFSHGDPIYLLDGEPINSGDPNVMRFTSQAFSNVAPGQKFKLGDFFYHNGSSYYDSHATGVILGIQLTIPERTAVLNFNLNLDLINTANDPDDANASADYVKITNLTQNIPLQLNGVNYRIKLEFGSTDSFGFSSQSQFHVYEGATGQGELLGTFLPY